MNYQSPFGGPPAMHDPYGGMMPPPQADYGYLGPPQFQPNPVAFDLAPSAPKPLPLIPPGSHGPSTPSGGGNFRLGRSSLNTNSKDPSAMKSRVFVGNLNTNLVTREQLHQVFSPFGEIMAVSLHKGYAFIQYNFETEARNAVTFTDGTMIAGKRIDVNIASEPKPSGDVPSGINKRSANVTIPLGGGAPEPKRAKFGGLNRSTSDSKKNCGVVASAIAAIKSEPANVCGGSTKMKAPVISVQSSIDAGLKQETLAKGDDIIICGQCRQLFTSIELFTSHKQTNACHAPTILSAAPAVVTQTSTTSQQTNNDDSGPVVKTEEGIDDAANGESKEGADEATSVVKVEKADGEPDVLKCFICHESFDRSWNLLVHIGQVHNMTVYEVSGEKNGEKAAKGVNVKKLF